MTGAPRPAARPGGFATTRTLLVALSAAAVAELLLLRTATRTFIHIPGLAEHDRLLGAVAQMGRASYYLAVVLAVAALAAMAHQALAPTRHRDVLTAIGLFLVAAIGLRAGAIEDLAAAIGVLAAVAIVGAALWRSPTPATERLPFVLFVGAFLLAGTHTTAQFASAGVALPDTSWLLLAAEVVAVLGAVLTPGLARGRPDRVAIGVATTTTFVALGALTGGGATLRILMLWNLGLAGWLPDLVYALAAGALAYTVTATARSGHRSTALAVTVLTCAGIGLHSTYQTALAIVALAALTLRARQDRVMPAPTRAWSASDVPAPTPTVGAVR